MIEEELEDDFDPEFEESIDEDSLLSSKINNNNFEDLIDRAIKKGALIELCSLIHNTLELYVVKKIYDDIVFNLRSKIISKSRRVISPEEEMNIRKEATDKISIIWGNYSRKHLIEYTEMAYILGLITKEIYSLINDFNTKRNKIIHTLLKPKSNPNTYYDIIEIAKEGREIQLRLSPIDHNEEDIKRIISKIDSIKKFRTVPIEELKDLRAKSD